MRVSKQSGCILTAPRLWRVKSLRKTMSVKGLPNEVRLQ